MCKLCGKERKLCLSHIIPEWAFRLLYDESSRAVAVNGDSGRPRTVQIGTREYLLCRGCEDLLNRRFDQPFHRFWSRPERFPEFLGDKRKVKISGIDASMTRNFLLSVLWRAHASQRELPGIDLGSHAERIRNILLAEPPAELDRDYPTYGYVLRDPKTGGLITYVLTPASNRHEGARYYCMAFLGCYWLVFVSRTPPPLAPSCRLQKDGTLIMGVIDYSDVGPFRQTLTRAAALHRARSTKATNS